MNTITPNLSALSIPSGFKKIKSAFSKRPFLSAFSLFIALTFTLSSVSTFAQEKSSLSSKALKTTNSKIKKVATNPKLVPIFSQIFLNDNPKKLISLLPNSYPQRAVDMLKLHADYYSTNADIYSDARLYNFNIYEKTDGVTRASYNLQGKYCSVDVNFNPSNEKSNSASFQYKEEYILLKEILRCTETVRNLANDLPDLYTNSYAREHSPETYKIINRFMNVGLAARPFAVYFGFNPFARYLENKISSEALLLMIKRYPQSQTPLIVKEITAFSKAKNEAGDFEFMNINYAWDDSYAMRKVEEYLKEKSSFIIIKNANNEDIHLAALSIGQGALDDVLKGDNFKAWAAKDMSLLIAGKPDWIAPPVQDVSLTTILTQQNQRPESSMEKAIVEKSAKVAANTPSASTDADDITANPTLPSLSPPIAPVASSASIKSIISSHPLYSQASLLYIYDKEYIKKVRAQTQKD